MFEAVDKTTCFDFVIHSSHSTVVKAVQMQNEIFTKHGILLLLKHNKRWMVVGRY